MRIVDLIIKRIALVLAALAGLALVAIALTIMLDVTMRYFRIPLIGAGEVVRVTFVASVYLAFAHVITQDREIRVDIFRGITPPLVQRLLDSLAGLVTLAFFALIAWFGLIRLEDNYTRGVYLEGRLLIPMWIPWLTIVAGSMMSVIAAALMIVRRLAGYAPAPASGDFD